MSELPTAHRDAVLTLVDSLEEDVDWALTGSTSFVLQGVPLDPDDVDVQTDEMGASAIEDAVSDCVVDPVTFSEAGQIRSHFGILEIEDVRVEVMGDIQRRRPDGSWSDPTDVTDHREFVTLAGREVPVLSLDYEVGAYRALGKDDRANLLAEYVD